MPLSIEDEKDINTYFSRNYEQGKALDISCPDKKSNQSWNDWKNWRLRKKGWQKNGKPFLTKKNKWKSEEPPRRLLREAGKSSGRGIHPSHLEFKVFLQDRIEKVSYSIQSPRFLHKISPKREEYEEYIETWKNLANQFQREIFNDNKALTKIPNLERRLLDDIDWVLKKIDDLDGLKIPQESGQKLELSHEDVLKIQFKVEGDKYKKTIEEISRIVVKSLISKSKNSYPAPYEIFQSWRDRYGDGPIIDFYNGESDSEDMTEFKQVKSELLGASKSSDIPHSDNRSNMWNEALKKFGPYERVDIHCTGFELIREIGEEISKLLIGRIVEVKKQTDSLDKRKKLGILSKGQTKQLWNDLFKTEKGLTIRGFGKRPPKGKASKKLTDWKEVTRHNSLQMAYNIVNILLEREYLSVRKMEEKEYRESFMDGDQDKEISRAAWKPYPYLLIFTDTLKEKIGKSEYSHFKGRGHNAIYRWMRQDPLRWMYCPPDDHNISPSGGQSYSDRFDDLTPGGFLNKELRTLVSNHKNYEGFQTPRSLPGRGTIDALNALQSVQWEINLDLLEKICDIRLSDDSLLGEFINSEGKPSKDHKIRKIDIKPELSNVFLREDDILFSDKRRLTLDYIERIIDLNANIFWHSWSCDFRGRMQPSCTVLSPQGNDIDRALIRFKEWKPLGEKGIEWLRIHVYNLMEGIEIQGWEDKECAEKLKSFKHRDEWVIGNLKLLRKISSDFNQYESELGLDRPASAKSVVFQRLAALTELDRVYSEWEAQDKEKSKRDWSKVISGQPVYIDASSNGYQHVSCLLRNRDLAKKVNLIPNLDNAPEDLYGLVANEARKLHGDEMRDILSRIPNWSDEDMETAIDAIFHRSIAKRPTMTRVYGSKDILQSLWGRGGEGKPAWAMEKKDPLTTEEREARDMVPPSAKAAYRSWKTGETDYWPLANLAKGPDGKRSWETYREWKKAMDEFRWLPVWAIGSSLYEGLVLNMEDKHVVRKAFEGQGYPKVQGDIAKLLNKSLAKAIDTVTDEAFSNFEGRLKDILKFNTLDDRFNEKKHDNKKKRSEYHIYRYDDQNTIIEKIKGNKAEARKIEKELMFLYPGTGWLLDDGFEVRNYYIKQDSDKTRKGAPTHVGSSYLDGLPDWYSGDRTSKNIVKRIKDVFLSRNEVKRLLEDRNPEISEIMADIDKVTNRSEISSILSRLERILPLGDDGIEITSLLHHRSYSFPRFNPDEKKRVNKTKPKSALAPNFVHSLDALHMRKTINNLHNEISSKSEGFGFWAVHDAFGTHPSDVVLMTDILKKQFRTIHKEKDMDGWIKNIAEHSGLNPQGDSVKDISNKLSSQIGDLKISEIATSDYLVH